LSHRLVGWLEFNVPFQHKYSYIRDQSHGLTIENLDLLMTDHPQRGVIRALWHFWFF